LSMSEADYPIDLAVSSGQVFHLTTDYNIVPSLQIQENEKRVCILTLRRWLGVEGDWAHNPNELYALMMGIGVDSRDMHELVADHCERS